MHEGHSSRRDEVASVMDSIRGEVVEGETVTVSV